MSEKTYDEERFKLYWNSCLPYSRVLLFRESTLNLSEDRIDELISLDADTLKGTISAEEYAALEAVYVKGDMPQVRKVFVNLPKAIVNALSELLSR